MNRMRIGVAVTALVLSAHLLPAQQPGPPRPHGRRGMMGDTALAQQQMRMMDSLNLRLDTLVDRMNKATGNEKVTAMAAVINELVAQRRVMQERMRMMMELRRGMMEDMMGEGRRPPP